MEKHSRLTPPLPLIRIDVFATSVEDINTATVLTQQLQNAFPGADIHFDLSDCDRILRIAGTSVDQDQVCAILRTADIDCQALPD